MTTMPSSSRAVDWTIGLASIVLIIVAVITSVVRHGSGSSHPSSRPHVTPTSVRCDPAAALRAAARITRETLTIDYHHEAAYLSRLRADLVDTDTPSGMTESVRSAKHAWPTVTAQQRIDTVAVHRIRRTKGSCRSGTYVVITTQRRTHYRHRYGFTASHLRHVRDTITVALVGGRFLAYGLPSPVTLPTP